MHQNDLEHYKVKDAQHPIYSVLVFLVSVRQLIPGTYILVSQILVYSSPNSVSNHNSYAVATNRLQAKWPKPWSWSPLSRPPVGSQRGVKDRKTAWHIWATIGGCVTIESWLGATKHSLDCQTTIALCNRQFLSFKFFSSLCRRFSICYGLIAVLLCELWIFLAWIFF